MVLLSHDDPKCLDNMSKPQFMKEDTSKLFHWDGGLQATKDPIHGNHYLRMHASVDEENLKNSIEYFAKLKHEKDAAVFCSGRNKKVGKEIRKQLGALKPKVNKTECTLEVDTEQALQDLTWARSRAGTVDLMDSFTRVLGNRSYMRINTAEPRRYLSGNTALRSMRGVPYLKPDDMIKVILKKVVRKIRCKKIRKI